MGKAPSRTSNVYFTGAGFSRAFNIPLTSQLLGELHARDESLSNEMRDAYAFLYPDTDAKNSGFTPDAVEYFSLLTAYKDMLVAFPQGMTGAPELLRRMKKGISRVITEGVRAAVDGSQIPALESILRPGNLIVTTNWDNLLEAYAAQQGHKLRFTIDKVPPDDHAVLIKLHESVD